MTIFSTRSISLIIFMWVLLVKSTHLSGQSNEQLYAWESGVAVNYSLNSVWSFNTALSQRSFMTETSEEDQRLAFTFFEIDHFANARIHPNLRFALGYKYRRRHPIPSGRFEHRLTQQLAWQHTRSTVRLVSRIRAEQRFRNNGLAHRYRYRLSADFPLKGAKLDPKEFYLAFSNELLLEAQSESPTSFENRFSGSIGFLFSKDVKAEVSAIFRYEDFNLDPFAIWFFNSRVLINIPDKSES